MQAAALFSRQRHLGGDSGACQQVLYLQHVEKSEIIKQPFIGYSYLVYLALEFFIASYPIRQYLFVPQ